MQSMFDKNTGVCARPSFGAVVRILEGCSPGLGVGTELREGLPEVHVGRRADPLSEASRLNCR